MGQPHKHAALIKAWADGAEIQKYNGSGFWLDDISPSWDLYEIGMFRIKPKTIKYRDALFLGRNYWVSAVSEEKACSISSYPGFIKWLGDWQEVVVE